MLLALPFLLIFLIIIQAGHMTKAHSIAYIPLIVASVLYVFNNKKLMLGAVFTSYLLAYSYIQIIIRLLLFTQ